MRSVFIQATLSACFLAAAVAASHAGVSVQVVDESNGRIVVEVSHDYAPNFSPLAAFTVAVSPTGLYTGKYYAGPAPVASKGTAAAAVMVDTLTLSRPSPYRGARILYARVRIPPFIPVSHVIIDYEPAAVVHTAAQADPLLKATVVNQNVFPIAPVAGTADPFFSRGGGWVQLSVDTRGVYAVSGADLAGVGVSTTFDPATLRLYTRGGLNETRAFDDPGASWRPGQAMREVPIRVEGGADGNFDVGDRVVFYGVGAADWADYYDAANPDTVFYEHTHADQNRYYLTWDSNLPGAPLRMADQDATPVAGADITTWRHREYRERDLIGNFDIGGDGWLWLDVPPGTGASTFNLQSVTVSNLVASRPQEFRTLALSPYQSSTSTVTIDNTNHHAVYLNDRAGQQVTMGEYVWDVGVGEQFYENGQTVDIEGSFLVDGANQIRLRVPRDLNTRDRMLFAWFSLAYYRRILANNDAVGFTSPDTSATPNFRANGFSANGALSAFDVTDPWNPVRLTGLEVTSAGTTRSARFSSLLTGTRRHYWVATQTGLRRPTVARVSPVDLRAETNGPNMVIVCDASMRNAADRLRLHRLSNLPFYGNPSVRVATTQDIYANFSGGLPDPMAVRNYFKYLFETFGDANGSPRLAYALLLGDANEDFRNHVSQIPDYVPTNVYFTRLTLFAFATDDWFSHLDDEDLIPGAAVSDIAVGRLPAGSVDEADVMVNKVIAYESQAPRESWRNRYILVADDENSSFVGACETQWTDESEIIATQKGPEFPETQKIYLTEYPLIAQVKPQSRAAFLEAWNAGAMVINYIGHGSSQQMADEQVFLGSDVSQLNNGLRLPLLMAYSCTIGDFANPAGKSLSEKLLLREEGGAIATITASRESYPNPNEKLCFAVFEKFLPRYLDERPLPLGLSLGYAKFAALGETAFQPFLEENSWKYNLLSDPALRLGVARQHVTFTSVGGDTLVAGSRRTLRGAVRNSTGGVDAGFNGQVDVVVREPATRRLYQTDCGPVPARYLVAGGIIYQGSADVTNGQFEVNFRVPRYAATGPLAFATAYARAGARDAAATIDSVLVVRPPTLEDSLALRPVDGAPRVNLGFKSGLTTVKTGDTVRAIVRDGDGINILSTTNEGKQAVLFDNVPLPLDVNEFFSFDYGGTDTSGVLLFPLPDLAEGRHRLVYKVSDSFGATTVDTLYFNVTGAESFFAEAVLNYPNPFPDDTKFLFRLSDRATIKLDIFTVSGKRVRHLEAVREGGEAWVDWDGRDASGSEIANGTYLYVATVDFIGVDRPAVTLRGKVARIR